MLRRHKLFVYGTLRPELKHPMGRFLRQHACLVGEGVIEGQLHNVGAYPAAERATGRGDLIHGAVFALFGGPRVLAALDRYEGTGPDDRETHRYVREEIDVALARGGHVRAWAYFYALDPARLPRIHGGDYVRFTSNMRRRS